MVDGTIEHVIERRFALKKYKRENGTAERKTPRADVLALLHARRS